MTEQNAEQVPQESNLPVPMSKEHMVERERFKVLKGIAKEVYESGLFPDKVNSAAQAFIILMTGKELGIGEMSAMRTINIIEGQASLSADLMVALVRRSGKGTFAYNRGEGFCECMGQRTDTNETYTVRWDRKRVEMSGVSIGKKGKKYAWQHSEPEMLKHRCDSEVCRALFPDLILRIYDPDELDMPEAAIEVVSMPSRTEAVKAVLGVVVEPRQIAAGLEDEPEEAQQDEEDPGLAQVKQEMLNMGGTTDESHS